MKVIDALISGSVVVVSDHYRMYREGEEYMVWDIWTGDDIYRGSDEEMAVDYLIGKQSESLRIML